MVIPNKYTTKIFLHIYPGKKRVQTDQVYLSKQKDQEEYNTL